MQAHKIETIIKQDGVLTLDNLPFKQGVAVEIIILERQVSTDMDNPYPLRGTLYHYDAPFEPLLSAEDWEALK